jgi:hypothetical protein
MDPKYFLETSSLYLKNPKKSGPKKKKKENNQWGAGKKSG